MKPIQLRPDESGPVLKPLDGDTEAGKYQLQGEIARGGVGTVLKGFDTKLGRDVAIKLLREDYLGNPDLLQRFVEEAQIGGQLQHPGIVPVYDVGLQGDQPFFSMKLVKGRTLAAMLEERPGPDHEPRKFLAIFEQVCHTMAYAHARAVIHRDLKPANVMVGAFGEVQVVDWGMGKVLGRGGIADETRAQMSVVATVRSEKPGSQSVVGSVMGTPAYMPPEQARGEVEQMDERSDVFALGAVLAEILTGAPPYIGAELIQQAAQAKLEACYERLDACTADEELKQLARACLAPARMARPKDASALADKIGGYLTSVDERAEQARLDAAEQQVKAGEAKRSQKLTIAIAASVLLTLVVGGGGWWRWQSEEAQRRADAGRTVQAALDEARVAYGKGDWDAALSVAQRAQALAKSDDVAPERKRDAAAYLADVERKQTDAREREERLERERDWLAVLESIPIPPDDTAGASVDPYGKPDAHRRDGAYRKAFLSFGLPIEKLPVDEAAARIRAMSRPDLWAAALDDWAWAAIVLHGRGPLRHQLLDVAAAADSDPQRTKLRAVRRKTGITLEEIRQPDGRSFPPMTARLYAEMLGSRGDADEAIAVLRAVAARHPSSFPIALRLAQWLNGRGELEEALRYASVASSVRPASASAAFLLGSILRMQERPVEAEKALRRAIRSAPTYGAAWHMLGHALEGQKRNDDALRAFRKAVAVAPNDAAACSCLGAALHRRRLPSEAEPYHRRAVALNPNEAMSFNNLGSTLFALRRYDDAEAAFLRAIELDEKLALAHANLANVFLTCKRSNDAIQKAGDALALDSNHVDAHCTLAHAYTQLGKIDDAERAALRAVSLDVHSHETHFALGIVRQEQGRLDEAAVAYRASIECGAGAKSYNNLGAVYRKQGRLDDAIQTFQNALDVDRTHTNASLNLAGTLVDAGRAQRAVDVCRVALKYAADDPELLTTLATALGHSGNPAAAETAARKALAVAPSHVRATWNLALALSAQSKHDDAMRLARQAVERGPEDVFCHAALGAVAQNADRLPIALNAYRTACRLVPDSALYHGALARLHHMRGELTNALRLYREAFRLDPELPELRRSFGFALYQQGHGLGRQGKLVQAVEAYRESIDIFPKLAEAWCDLGLLLRDQGRYAEALRHLEKGHALGQKRETWQNPSAKWVEETRKRAAWEPTGERILTLEDKPGNAFDAFQAVVLGMRREEHAQVVALVRAIESDYPDVRYNGACAAALLAAGDVPDAERKALRADALRWLRADLLTKPRKEDLEHALKDADLDSVRGGEFAALWRDVRAALDKLK